MKVERECYTLRLPKEMGQSLKDMADNECMPKNAFIIQLLRKGMREIEEQKIR